MLGNIRIYLLNKRTEFTLIMLAVNTKICKQSLTINANI